MQPPSAGKYSHVVHFLPDLKRWVVARRCDEGWETRCLARGTFAREVQSSTLEGLRAQGAQTYANERAAIKAYRRRFGPLEADANEGPCEPQGPA